MKIGLFSQVVTRLDAFIADADRARSDGFATYWVPQVFSLDAVTAIAVAGREVQGIEFGTAVVPIQPRHPQGLASAALTTQSACGNRFTLGIGLSHRVVVEQMWGLPWDRPVRRMREYLDALVPMLAGEPVSVEGETVKAMGKVTVRDVSIPGVLLAALGPQMLKLAGASTDGTITWCTGPQTIASHVVPALLDAAEAANRADPRVVAALPICVTGDAEGARTNAARKLASYGQLPSYRAMLDREGAAGPADIMIVGSEEDAFAALDELRGAGVTDFAALEVVRNDEEAERTRAFLRSQL